MVKIIPLTREKEALVDDEDYENVTRYHWHCMKSNFGNKCYGASLRGRKSDFILLHRFLLPGYPLISFVDGNGLNCQRHNLRPATRRQAIWGCSAHADSFSKYKGVSRKRNKFAAEIYAEGKKYKLGAAFVDEIEAAKAYDDAAKELFGEYARLNFPSK